MEYYNCFSKNRNHKFKMAGIWSAGSFAFFNVIPALRFIPAKSRDARSDQGYKLRSLARKSGIAAEKQPG
uniref:hypothetical protein n=1 Tax=Pedobacter suwonensis TaxID=332999 RepID=UPI0011A9AF68|nr:hypothetical protein [Pedobacter suwonensis]